MRIGDFMQCASGRRFWPLDPRVEDVAIEDIAHHLSNLCRYNGATARFYSVAEHSVLVSYAVPEADALAGLLHDAAEAYIGDVIRPIKSHAILSTFRTCEADVEAVIARAFGLPTLMPPAVREVDTRIIANEARALMLGWHEWPGLVGVEPVDLPVRPVWGLTPGRARASFLERFEELTARPAG